MNLLVTHRELDMAGYDMLQRLSYDSDLIYMSRLVPSDNVQT